MKLGNNIGPLASWRGIFHGTATANKQRRSTVTGKLHGLLTWNILVQFWHTIMQIQLEKQPVHNVSWWRFFEVSKAGEVVTKTYKDRQPPSFFFCFFWFSFLSFALHVLSSIIDMTILNFMWCFMLLKISLKTHFQNPF